MQGIAVVVTSLAHVSHVASQADNGMSPISVTHVRNMFNIAPVAFPWDRYPSAIVSCSSREDSTTGYKSFCYLIRDNATPVVGNVSVTHLFTGNESHLQEEPTKLWMDLQRDVPLVWQSVDTSLAAGTCVGTCKYQIELICFPQVHTTHILCAQAPSKPRKRATQLQTWTE